MMTFSRFIELVESTPSISTYQAAATSMPEPPQGNLPLSALSWDDQLVSPEDMIRSALTPSLSQDGISLAAWRSAGVYQSVLDNESVPTSTLLVADLLCYKLGNSVADAPEQNWVRAIAAAKVIIHQEQTAEGLILETAHRKDYHRAMAAKRLRQYGLVVSYESGRLVIQEGEQQVAARIEEVIQRYGGLCLWATIFQLLLPHFDEVLDRYIVPNAPGILPADVQPAIPYAYLANLCAKHAYLGAPATVWDTERMVTDVELVLQLGRDLLSVWGGQRYNIWGSYMVTKQNLVEYLESAAVFDACFYLPQGNMTIEINDARRLFAWADPHEFERFHGFKIDQYLAVCSAIDAASKGRRGPQFIERATLAAATERHIPSVAFARILAALCHQSGRINEGFSTPFDQRSVNVVDRLLIPATETGPRDAYFLLDYHWSSPAVYNVLYQLCGEVFGKQTDVKIGECLEELVVEVFSAHGVRTHRGRYKMAGKEGDCDLLIETPAVILVIEVKKTPLWRETQTGEGHQILANLAASLVKAQEQAAKIEQILRELGHIELQDATGKTCRIPWQGRKLFKMALTHRDYFSLQDHAWMDRLLSVLLDAQVTILSPENVDQAARTLIDKLNKSLQNLTLHYLRNHPDPTGLNADRPYLDCHFFSLPMIKMLLAGVTDVEQFLANYDIVRRSSVGSGNFYFEYQTLRREWEKPGNGPWISVTQVDGLPRNPGMNP